MFLLQAVGGWQEPMHTHSILFVNNVAINVNSFVVFKYEIAYKLTKHEVEITKNKKNFSITVCPFFI